MALAIVIFSGLGFAVLAAIFICGFIDERRHNAWMAARGYRLSR